jgi:hypothetical protein
MVEETGTETTEPETTETDVKDWKAEAEKWQSHARKQEERAKSNAQAAKELEKVRAAAMTEQERAAVEARAAGIAEAQKATAPRLIRAELRAAAAEAGLAKDALDGFLEYADLSKFVTDDGEPDGKAIAAAVKKLGGTGRGADFDGGARGGPAAPKDMNSKIRHLAGFS